MECMHCKGKMEKGKSPFHIERNGYQLHWDAVPAWVCNQCGESSFEDTEVDMIQRAISIIEKECSTLVVSC